MTCKFYIRSFKVHDRVEEEIADSMNEWLMTVGQTRGCPQVSIRRYIDDQHLTDHIGVNAVVFIH